MNTPQHEPGAKAQSMVLVVFLLIGLFASVSAAFTAISHSRFVARAIEVPGEVTAVERTGRYYYPRFAYTDHLGKPRILISANGQRPPAFYEGQKVVILLDTSDPDFPLSAKVKTFGELWFLPIALGIFGGVFCAIPIGFWLVGR
jgi:hypothetical protein